MKRVGLKVSSLILTIISIVILILSFPLIIDSTKGAIEALTVEETNGAGLLVLFLFFFVVAAMLFIVLAGIGGTSLISIIINSIDLSKTLRDNGNIVFNIVMLSVNFILYAFVTGIILYVVSA